MSDSGLSEKQLKKRESNIKYREKLKQRLNESKLEEPKVEEPVPEVEPAKEQEQEPEAEADDTLIIDKKAYLYLLEKARQNETEPLEKPKEETKKEEPRSAKEEDKDSFFFLLKNSFKTTAISLIPVLTMQLAVHGGRLLTSSTNNFQSKRTLSQSNKQPTQPMTDYGLPSVNAL